MLDSRNIKYKLFVNGKDALDYIQGINCNKNCKKLVYTDFNMP